MVKNGTSGHAIKNTKNKITLFTNNIRSVNYNNVNKFGKFYFSDKHISL